MTSASNRMICFICNKQKLTYPCQGCSNIFCFDHLTQHRTDPNQQLDQIQNDHDQFRQKINDQKVNPTEHGLVRQINRWEKESINKIKQMAKECKQEWINYSNQFFLHLENKLNNFTEQIKAIQRENEVNEIDLNHLRQKFEKLQKELDQPREIFIRQQPTPFINRISLPFSSIEKGHSKSDYFTLSFYFES